MKINEKIYIIIGTRAQIIKMLPVMLALNKAKIEYILVFTGQHYKTMYSMLKRFGLRPPDVILDNRKTDVISVQQFLKWFLKTIFKAQLISRSKARIALIHGDAPSALLAAIICKLRKIKIGLVEAGLRSFNIWHPFPEELTRLILNRMVDYYFVQNETGLENLKKTNKPKINLGDNTLLDTLRLVIDNQIKCNLPAELKTINEKYCIVTIHRFENISTKKVLKNIINLLINVSKKIKLVFVLHPPTEERLKKWNLFKLFDGHDIVFCPRLDYIEFITLARGSEFVITDGGSCQEEASYMGIPCLLFRKATERVEGMQLDQSVVLSNFEPKIINDFVDNYQQYKTPGKTTPLSPSDKVVAFLKEL